MIKKIGRYNTMLLGNLIVIMGCLPQLALNFSLQLLGKFLVGLGSNFTIFGGYVFTAETLPGPNISSCLTAVSLGICSGYVLSSGLQSISLPPSGSPDYLSSGSWRIGFSAPIFLSLINYAQLHFWIQGDSVMNNLKQFKTDEALVLLKKVFIFEDDA